MLHPVELTAAENAEHLRKIKGLSYQELADDAGVPKSTVVAFCKGRYSPSLGLAHDIAKALGTTIAALEKKSRRSAIAS